MPNYTMKRIVYLTVVALFFFHSAVSVTQSEVADAVISCNNLIDADPAFIGGLVRLAFHDCIGGCDGCVDLSVPDNNGLGVYITPLNAAFASLSLGNSMSRADFWMTCSATAAQRGFLNIRRRLRPQSLDIGVLYGRQDTDCSSPPSRQFPSALHGLPETVNFFQTTFGFNQDETVALLGAHTLGRTRINNSGFNGPWVGNEVRLDNQYYIAMVQPWRQVEQQVGSQTTNWQWIRPARPTPVPDPTTTTVMLNSDICFAFDINPDNTGRNSIPQTNRITGRPSTRALVEHYAADNTAWLSDFAAVFTKLISNVDSSITLSPAV